VATGNHTKKTLSPLSFVHQAEDDSHDDPEMQAHRMLTAALLAPDFSLHLAVESRRVCDFIW
jgi:hypothetical protein